MSPRPRKPGNKDLPPNLHPTRTGYEYRRPDTGKRFSMGADRHKAIAAAKVLNTKLMPKQDLVAKVMGGATVAQVVDRFRQEFLPERDYSPRTAQEIEYRLNRITRELGTRNWPDFGLDALSDWLHPLTRAAYIKHRQQWIDIYRFACAVGLADKNLAEMTLKRKPEPRKRRRWTLEQYRATWNTAEPWLQIAMDLALFSLQRREDLVNLRKREDFTDGRLLIAQHKTGKRLAIRAAGNLLDAIRAAVSANPFCPYLVSKKPERKNPATEAQKRHPFQVLPGYLTKAVARARDASGLFDDVPAVERPTLHELRSLGAHLYREAGYPEKYIQGLLGHSDAKMTAHYLDGHREEWDEVSADLILTI